MATYKTKQGDTWDGISNSQYGTEGMTDALMMANGKYLSYFTFPAGVVLNLPEKQEHVDSQLPPWKQVNG